jgi:transposase
VNRAAAALRLAATSLFRSRSALGAYLRRMTAKLGKPAAITATAHKLARLIYSMLRYGTEYVDAGQDYYERAYRERVVRNLTRRAKELGLVLVPEAGETAVT